MAARTSTIRSDEQMVPVHILAVVMYSLDQVFEFLCMVRFTCLYLENGGKVEG